MKVVVNVPSLAIEEVTPSFQSDANLLAPEEIQAKPRSQDVRKLYFTRYATLVIIWPASNHQQYDDWVVISVVLF